ncbi:copper homeostasis protein [Dysgonomonas hofstadii]|uniref:PF03932 family protein CutC n=1 Tax=Dysgonomonas hofstadii TaxID=637886 RepID=A0A840CTB3_9BACT|nr:copper homeostasis protein CutC [Dysgonomonas hofstadii]MBB4037929.1 copper homeostasis protein [Dysgonomonas hofstadii]
MISLEVCANSTKSAIEGQKGGAIRIELCDNLAEGGTTPSLSQIEKTRQLVDIQLNILIRPREGDFLYSDLEFEIMKQDIHYCGHAGCDGVVFGILNNDGSIDKKRNKELLKIAKEYDMNATFHRAFDRCKDLFSSLEDIIELGFDHILTSGGEKTAPEGKDTLKKLIEQADNKIVIMPGGGITEENINELAKYTGLKEFHGSFRSRIQSQMEYFAPIDDTGEYTILQTDVNKVKEAILNANKI